jgi:hypothetical protein
LYGAQLDGALSLPCASRSREVRKLGAARMLRRGIDLRARHFLGWLGLLALGLVELHLLARSGNELADFVSRAWRGQPLIGGEGVERFVAGVPGEPLGKGELLERCGLRDRPTEAGPGARRRGGKVARAWAPRLSADRTCPLSTESTRQRKTPKTGGLQTQRIYAPVSGPPLLGVIRYLCNEMTRF